jgi:glycine dehydrogenase
MLQSLGYESMDQFISAAVPEKLRTERPYNLPEALSEDEARARLRELADKNVRFRSLIGAGYSGTITPAVINRNVFENPAWYTQYTPYQAEIAQGRLEALLNFQTMVSSLAGMDIANASLLDEATAAAEAMMLAKRVVRGGDDKMRFFVSEGCHPQTIAVIRTRAQAFGYQVEVGNEFEAELDERYFGIVLQYPTTRGAVHDYEELVQRAHDKGALAIVAADLLALTLYRSPGSFGADVVVGNSQRFGVPLWYGGPHAAFMAVRDQYKRKLPGRLVGVSQDQDGNNALRLALQTREQHIRRDAATSNICTAQVLLAVAASFYGVYHGPDGLSEIAERVHLSTMVLRAGLEELGYDTGSAPVFDTLTVYNADSAAVRDAAEKARINLRYYADGAVGVALDERTRPEEIESLLHVFAAVGSARSGGSRGQNGAGDADGVQTAEGFDAAAFVGEQLETVERGIPSELERESAFMTEPVFHRHRSETELMRYIKRLENRDLSLVHSMIPLGSCTMKLNAAVELESLSWPEFHDIHPWAPKEQTAGYRELIDELDRWLCELTGFYTTSFQPNAGAQGEYAGLLAIRAYHTARGESQRHICLVPESAHGTNPASAVMAGMKVVVISCDSEGNVDLEELTEKAEEHKDELAALMLTYPSTHGVFEEHVREVCKAVHDAGGQVYLDGANMNALVGLIRPAELGADVCHLNLHKTFCIPHGGGGPGMGPICVAEHLAGHLPASPTDAESADTGVGPIASAEFGSPGILTISYAYIAMMGGEGLRSATKHALLNANYLANRIEESYPVLYRGRSGHIAHECIVDVRFLKGSCGVEAEDVAKRLADYGFHAPTMSWPVPGTLMVEPTESENKEELDRFVEAMAGIREEARAVENGDVAVGESVLRHAPHTLQAVTATDWDRAYSREEAGHPRPWVAEHKVWPAVGRVDNVYGDRNVVCSCAPIQDYM